MLSTRSVLTVLFLAIPLLVGCNKEQPAATIPVPSPPGGKVNASQSHGSKSTAASASAGATVTGTIVETMDSGGYTYLKLATPKGEQWAAVKQTAVSKGTSATVVEAMLMNNFTSTTLKRTFEKIYFGSLGKGGAANENPHPNVPAEKQLAAAHKRVAGDGKIAVDKALPKAAGAEGRTIAEIHAQKAALNGKGVAVRGKVTKFNRNIMGRNWLHIQDGTGSAKAKNFDLTVTSKEDVAVGDLVLVTGTLATDKDFGAGYRYGVIVEQAKLAKDK